MRSILVHADHDAPNEARLQAALDIARRQGAHVTLMISTPFRQFITIDPFGGSYVATDALAKAQADDTILEARLEERLAKEDVPWDIVVADGDLVGSLAIGATLSDLVIVSLPGERREARQAMAMLAGDLALAAPVPVLALPQAIAALDFDAPAMIAWNGSQQAATALRAAVPLLAGRRAVTLVTVGEDNGGIPAADALRYLSRHDIHADLKTVQREVETVEQRLAQEGEAMGAGLLVMGAFGRGRLRETIFGGATHYLVTEGRIPLLLAH